MRLGNAHVSTRAGKTFVSLLLGGALLLAPARMSAQTQDSLALRTWGNASTGQVGDGGDETRRLPITVRIPGKTRAVAAGWRHSLALGADGTVWAWGSNDQCQAGKKDALYLTLPLPVGGVSGVRVIAAGGGHSLALRADGTVWAWGGNTFGQLGRGVATTRFNFRHPLPVGGPDGRAEPAPVKNLADVIAIAAGDVHSLALKADGTVWAWGRNVWGELGTGTRHLARPAPRRAAHSGSTGILAALRQGEEPGDASLPLLVESIDQVAGVAAGPDTSFAIRKDGTLWNWGVISRKPSAQGSYTYSAAPIQIKALRHVIAVAPGATHTLALTADGAVWAWGSNNWGELGDGTLQERETPARVEGLGRITAIAAGNGHSAALQSDGRVWTWGHNAEGELGDGAQINRPTPTAVKDVSQAVAISAGECHCLALTRSTPNQISTPGHSAASAARSPEGGPAPAVTAALAGADGTVAYKTYYEVDPFHWSSRAVSELRGNDVIPSYPDCYENLIQRRQFALNIQRGLDYSVLGRPGPNGSHFPAGDPQSLGFSRHGARPTLWPQEARLLRRLTREYRPDLIAFYKQANRDPGELDEAERRLDLLERETAPLDTPVTGLKMTNAAVEDVYTRLTQGYHVPLSLIETQANTRVSIDVQAGTARDVLDQLRAQASAYRLRTIQNRLILMPSASRFETIVAQPTFTNVPRIEATQRCCDYLSKNVAGLSGLSAPLIIMGDPNAPILTEPVTLRGRTTILERFVQLLGKDPRACFYIHRHLTYTDTLSLFYICRIPDVVNDIP